MSIRRITAVWDHSATKANDRLCLIVLADKANDAGYCWPGLTCIQEQMNATRQTALASLDRLTDMGEIYAERKQRIGSKFLVLPGLSDEQILEGLMKHFDMEPEQAQSELETIRSKRDKSRNHTSNTGANLDRINTAKKSRNHTKKVYALDQNSLAARLDPSLPVIETPIADTPTAVSAAPAKPQKQRKPVPVKTLADLDQLRRVIAINAHNIKPGEGITARTMIRINMVAQELELRFGTNGTRVSPEELAASFKEYAAQPNAVDAPKDPVKVADMVSKRRDRLDINGPVPIVVHFPAGVSGCPMCDGTGMVADEHGKTQPCPKCLEVEAHHGRQAAG